MSATAIASTSSNGRRVPPHSSEAEESVIGGILVHPKTFNQVAELLTPEDFYHPAQRAIYEAMVELDRAGKPIDALTVVEQMRALDTVDKLRAFHGADHLTVLMSQIVTVENIPYHAGIIRSKATARRLVTSCTEVAARGYGEYVDVGGLVAAAVEFSTKAELELAQRGQQLTAAQRARELGEVAQRFETGIEALDLGVRGGIPFRRLAIFGGAPGAGKTTFLTQVGHKAASEQLHVAVLACDQGINPILERIGQQIGLVRDALESRAHRDHADAVERLASHLETLPTFHVLDGDELTVEQASRLLGRYGGGPGVLIVDSLQTARSSSFTVDMTERQCVKLIVDALKRAARRDGHLVLATSELNRGSYRSRDASQNGTDLAAFMGSNAIEYGADLALLMKSVKGDSALVDVDVAKCRLGQMKPFRLQINHVNARLDEVPREDDAGPGAGGDDDFDERVFSHLVAAGEPLSGADIRVGMRARNEKVNAALRRLQTGNRVETVEAEKLTAGGRTCRFPGWRPKK